MSRPEPVRTERRAARGERFTAVMAACVRRLPFGLAGIVAPSLLGFAVINLFTFAVDLLLLTTLHGGLRWPLPVSITVAYLTAFGLSFVLNRALNFRSHGAVGPQVAVYAAVVAVNYLVWILGVGDGLAALGADYRLARIAAGVCEALYMYAAMRWLVFRDVHAQDRRRMSRPGELGAMGPYTAAVTAGVDGPFELGTDGPTAILVGIDGSTTSLRAASYAAGLARRQHARVTAVYVAPVASLGAAGPGGADLAAARHQAFSQAAEDMRRRAEEVSRELGIPVTFIAVEGDPFTELRRIADETRADAVVVGASAHAGHRLVGSLAVRLVRAGRWPVTVVP